MVTMGRRKHLAVAVNAALEELEGRTLFAAVSVDEIGDELRITGTGGEERITVKQTSAGLRICGDGFKQTFYDNYDTIVIDARGGDDVVRVHVNVETDAVIYGGGGADRLVGGSGNDRIFAGGACDTVVGGAGDDVLVALGQGTDRATGGAGRDSFWADSGERETVTDASDEEIELGAVHRVASFYSYRKQINSAYQNFDVDKKLNGQDLEDPTLTSSYLSYKDFSNRPLFGEDGPHKDDIAQGWLGDCYFLATLSSIADVNPDKIRESVVDLGDGTYAVNFFENGQDVYVRVDADLPTWSWGDLAYANAGADGSIWVALMEKAYAYFRYDQGSYASIEGGWMSSVYSALGCSGSQTIWSAADGNTLLTQIEDLLEEGKSVTFAVYKVPAGAPVVSSHAYSVEAVVRDGQGNLRLVLRNPWGVDGVGNDGSDDGYVTLSATHAHNAFWGVIAARV